MARLADLAGKFVRTSFIGGTREHVTSACEFGVSVTREEWTPSVRGA